MARVEISEVVLRPDSQKRLRPVAGASVQVNLRGGGAANVYAAAAGGAPVPNPLTTDSEGRIEGWVEEGSYDLVVSAGGASYTQAFEGWSGSTQSGSVRTQQGPLTQAAVDALIAPGATLYETDAAGNVVAEWVKTSE